MTTTSATAALLRHLADRLGSPWSVEGGHRVRAQLAPGVQYVIKVLPAGSHFFTVTVVLGPRFAVVERIVAKANRAAGLPEAALRTAAMFPTVFESLDRVSDIPGHVSIHEHDRITAAMTTAGLPLLERIGSVGAAADYAFTQPLAYGHHAQRIPVLLAKCGRRAEAEAYIETAIAGPFSASYADYARQLRPLIF